MPAAASPAALRGAAWPLATLFLFVLLVAANPIGFRGGGSDDWQYLQAARCWMEHGPCLPRDHWWGRWPLVAPLSGLILLLGESRTTLALLPFAVVLGCGLLIAQLGNRLFGKPAGWLATMLFLSTPSILFEALDPTIDTIELLFLLGAVALLLGAVDQPSRLRFAAAGLAVGLGFQARETSAALLPAIGLFLLLRVKPFWPAALAFAAGALLPLLAELATFWAVTGDPLFRRSLSLAHTSLPSSELSVATPRGEWPFFRWSLIAHWQHETGIRLHWLVDGVLDVLLNPKGGWTLLAALLALPLLLRRLARPERQRAAFLLLAGVAHLLLLVFAFSIDPKPRVMSVPLTAACLVLAALLLRLPRWTWLFPIVARVAALSSTYLFEPRMAPGEEAARRWLSELPAGSVETSESTRRRLALVPAAQNLPLADGSRPLLLIRTSRPCATSRLLELAPSGSLLLVREQQLGPSNPVTGKYRALCLFRYASPQAARVLAAAHDAETPFTDEAPEPRRASR